MYLYTLFDTKIFIYTVFHISMIVGYLKVVFKIKVLLCSKYQKKTITLFLKYLIFLQNEQVLLEKDNKIFVLQGDLDLAEEKLFEIENNNKKVSLYDNSVKTRLSFL